MGLVAPALAPGGAARAQDAAPAETPTATATPTSTATATPTPTPTGPDEPTVRLARGTWDTGWFQAEIHRQLLMRIGYRVEGPTTMENAEFFSAVADGGVDMWANGWFPLHQPLMEPGAETVGTQIDAGALTGYFVDMASASEHDITSISDVSDPELVEIFDVDGNGLADLYGCNEAWACGPQVNHHLEEFGLSDTVEQVQADYSALMNEIVVRQEAGEPVLFYGFTPHWILGEMVPGEDVRWLQTPGATLPDQQVSEQDTLVSGIDGCVADPCQTGFPPNDIQSVANNDFLADNPSVRRLLEQVTIPLGDILDQNALMFRGQGSEADIRNQAGQWIADNADTVDEWVTTAAPDAVPVTDRAPGRRDGGESLRVAVRTLEPFVLYEQLTYAGYSVELADAVGAQLGREVEVYGVNSVAKQLDDVGRGVADMAVAAISITSDREQHVDFSLPVFQSGLSILVPTDDDAGIFSWATDLMAAVFGSGLAWMVLAFGLVLLLSAHLIWWFEHNDNPDFPPVYRNGIWDSFWWATVTITTVGYGDKTPKGRAGQGFALLWMIVGYFVFASFTASITSSLAVNELRGSITGPSDLPGQEVVTLANSEAEDWLISEGIGPVTVGSIDDAYAALDSGEVDAVVFDAPVLQYRAARDASVRTVGSTFDTVRYGIAVHDDADQMREQVNLALLELIETGAYDQLSTRWFGDLEDQ